MVEPVRPPNFFDQMQSQYALTPQEAQKIDQLQIEIGILGNYLAATSSNPSPDNQPDQALGKGGKGLGDQLNTVVGMANDAAGMLVSNGNMDKATEKQVSEALTVLSFQNAQMSSEQTVEALNNVIGVLNSCLPASNQLQPLS